MRQKLRPGRGEERQLLPMLSWPALPAFVSALEGGFPQSHKSI